MKKKTYSKQTLKNERKVYLEQIPQLDNATLRKVRSICLWYFLLILWKKTRHTGDFPRFHFETAHKLFSITVIPLFSHRPLIVINVMIPLKLNLSTYYVCQNPYFSAYLSSPPLPSWVVKGKVPVCRLISDCLVCSASLRKSAAQIPTLIGESWSQKLVQKWQKKNIQRYWLLNFEC